MEQNIVALLRALIDKIEMGDFRNVYGHELTSNVHYLAAKAALVLPQTDDARLTFSNPSYREWLLVKAQEAPTVTERDRLLALAEGVMPPTNGR